MRHLIVISMVMIVIAIFMVYKFCEWLFNFCVYISTDIDVDDKKINYQLDVFRVQRLLPTKIPV